MNANLTRKRRLLFYTLFLAYISAGILTILPGPTLPLLAAHTAVPLEIAGWSFTASASGFSLGVVIAGVLSGRFGPKYILMSGLVIMAVSGVIIPWTHLYPVLLVSQFIKGITLGFLDVSINMIITISFHDNLGEALNNLHSSFGLGALVAPLFLSLALQLVHDALWAYVAGSILGLLSLFLLVGQPVPSMLKQNATQQQPGIPVISIFRVSLVWLMAIQLFLYVGAEVGFSDWIVTVVSQSAAVSLVLAAPAATTFWLGLTIGRLLGGQVLRRGILSENQLLYISAVGGGISGLLVAIFTGQILLSFSTSALMGLFLGPIFPGIMAIASRRFVHNLAIVSGILLTSAGAAPMTLPVLMGYLIPHLGVNWVITIPAFASLFIVIPFSLAIRQQRSALQLPADVHTMEQETQLPI